MAKKKDKMAKKKDKTHYMIEACILEFEVCISRMKRLLHSQKTGVFISGNTDAWDVILNKVTNTTRDLNLIITAEE